MRVLNTLGAGFLEKVYENALVIELRKAGLHLEQQRLFRLMYEGTAVGDYWADIVVDGTIILKLKAVKAIDNVHEAQLLNYLKASGLGIGLILNFGNPKLGIKRMVW